MIPTAEEYILNHTTIMTMAGNKEKVKNALIEFTKFHVEAALKAVSEKAKITYEYSGNTGSEYCNEYIDRNSILNSYPLENIK